MASVGGAGQVRTGGIEPEQHLSEQTSSLEWYKKKRFVALVLAVAFMLLIGGGVPGVTSGLGMMNMTDAADVVDSSGVISGLLPGGLPTPAFATENTSVYTGDTIISAQGQIPLSATDDANNILVGDIRQPDRAFSDIVIIALTIVAVLGFLLIVKNRRKEDRRKREIGSHLHLR
ncbi:MAG: hypothetical protein LBK67_10595 [Coriobacteriales bacterium]|jgi:hypothetical protein|nr:hypothetical protein [Coriobacteriales bacterium]